MILRKMMLAEEDVAEEAIPDAENFHFGTLSMTHEGVRKATKKAISIAKEKGIIISFDPNLRPSLWESMEIAREQVLYGLNFCDVLKISDNEIQWLTGKKEFDEGACWIKEKHPEISLILLSLGKDGSRAYYKDVEVEVPAFVQEKTIETTGAGDTFCGCMLHGICKYGLGNLDSTQLKKMLTFANAAASLITMRKGALRVMPSKEEVENMLAMRCKKDEIA